MKEFFKLWTNVDFSLQEIETFYYEYLRYVEEIDSQLDISISKLTKYIYDKNKEYLDYRIETIDIKFKQNVIFYHIFGDIFDKFLMKRNVTNIAGCISINKIYDIFSAYKLFYVGCSRARKNLQYL